MITVGAAGQIPRVDDRRGSIQAETIVVHFEGPDLEATGQMGSVLTSAPADADGSAVLAVKRPQLLAEGPPIYVTAGRLVTTPTSRSPPTQTQRDYGKTRPSFAARRSFLTRQQGT